MITDGLKDFQTKNELFNSLVTEKGGSNVSDPESYIKHILESKAKRRVVFSLCLLFLGGLILFSQENYLSNLFSGSRATDGTRLEAEILSGKIEDINLGLQLPPDSVQASGYTHITQEVNQTTNAVESQKTDHEYYLTVVGKHVLVLEGEPNQTPVSQFNGVLVPIDTDLKNNLVSDFNKDSDLKDLSSSILPYMISDRGMYGLDEFWYCLIGLAILCWGAFGTFKVLRDPEDKKHYLYRSLENSGYGSLEALSRDFVNSQKEGIIRMGSYRLTDKFLFSESYFHFKIYPLSQLHWAYKKVIKKSVNFIPTGKDYGLVMHFRPNITAEARESEDKVHKHLMLIAALYPAVKIGYTK